MSPITRTIVTVVAMAFGVGLATAPTSAQELLISAAVSMKDAVIELGPTFTSRRPGVIVRFNFGASGELQKQLEAGAPVDLFISAGQRQMDELEQKALILSASRRVFARNVLVVVKPVDSSIDLVKPVDLRDLEELLAKHTGQPVERVHADTDRDFVMEADEALAYGIIDSVIESRDVADRTGAIR